MEIWLVALEFSGAYFAEGYAAPVVGVDVGGYLEDESGKGGVFGGYDSLFSLGGFRTGGYFDETVE